VVGWRATDGLLRDSKDHSSVAPRERSFREPTSDRRRLGAVLLRDLETLVAELDALADELTAGRRAFRDAPNGSDAGTADRALRRHRRLYRRIVVVLTGLGVDARRHAR